MGQVIHLAFIGKSTEAYKKLFEKPKGNTTQKTDMNVRV
jgi:hypothetical protein